MQEFKSPLTKKKSNGFGGSSFEAPDVEMKSESIDEVLAKADAAIEGEQKALAEKLANEEKEKSMSYGYSSGFDRCSC